MKIRNFTKEDLKKVLIATRPEGFLMAFAADQPDPELEVLVKIKKDGIIWGRMLVQRFTGETILWQEGRFSSQMAFESPEGAMSGLRILLLCGEI